MTVRVQLNVFSGRANPEWDLSPDQVIELRERLGREVASSHPSKLRPPALLKRGYQGFSVITLGEPQLPAYFYVDSGIIDFGPGFSKTRRLASKEDMLEHWLLGSANLQLGLMTGRTQEYVRNAIAEDARKFRAPFAFLQRWGGRFRNWFMDTMSVWEPSVWEPVTIRLDNNCYNYGADKITNTYAKPGRANGITVQESDISCETIKSAAEADGLVFHNKYPSTVTSGHVMALSVAEGDDFHWFRRDESGYWSDKFGKSRASDKFCGKGRIKDPKKIASLRCGRFNDYSFCGYFVCPPNVDIS